MKRFFILGFVFVIININNGFTQTYINEYGRTDLETIFSYGVITSNINYSIRTELNAKNIRLFQDSLGYKEFDVHQLPVDGTLKNIRTCSNDFYELIYDLGNNQDKVVSYLSLQNIIDNNNVVLVFWLKDVLLNFGKNQNQLNHLNEVLRFSFSKIYYELLVNSNGKKVKTIDTVSINSYNNLSISFKDCIIDTNYYLIPKRNWSTVNESCSLLIINKANGKKDLFKIKREYVGFSYIRKDDILQGISFPINWIIWDTNNLRNTLPDIEYRLLKEYINVLLFIQITK